MANRMLLALYVFTITSCQTHCKGMRYVAISFVRMRQVLDRVGEFEDTTVVSPMLCAALAGRRGAVAYCYGATDRRCLVSLIKEKDFLELLGNSDEAEDWKCMTKGKHYTCVHIYAAVYLYRLADQRDGLSELAGMVSSGG